MRPAARTRSAAATLALLVAVAACGGPAGSSTASSGSATPPPSGSSAGPGASAPATSGPGPSAPTPTAPPPIEIPAPTIDDPYEIGAGLADPAQVADAVSSVLDRLGIGIYALDGTPIRPGLERGPGDLWLFEDEVRGLIEMGVADSAALAAGATPATTGDLVRPLAELALVEPEVISAAYDEAYTWGEETVVTQVVGGRLDFLDLEAPASRVLLWLALADGVVGTEPSGAALAGTAALGPVALPRRTAPTVDLPFIPSPIPGLSVEDFALALAHAPVIGYTIPFEIEPGVAIGHKGHAGPGDTVALAARYRPMASPLVSPITGIPLFPLRSLTGLDGLAITWEATSGNLEADGDPTVPLGTTVATDTLGEARLEVRLHPEDGDGTGMVSSRSATVEATVELRDLVSRVFDVHPTALSLVAGRRAVPSVVVAEFHEPALEAGEWRLVLSGPRAGAGSYDGTTETFYCSAPLVDGTRTHSATVGPGNGTIRQMDVLVGFGHDAIGVITTFAYDNPIDWFADATFGASISVEARFDQDPKVMIARASWVEDGKAFSIEMTLGCPTVAGL